MRHDSSNNRGSSRLARILSLLILTAFQLPLMAASDKPDLYLLAIGVSDYEDAAIPDLTYADDDAAALERWARAQEGHLFNKVFARVLLSRDATREAVIQALLEHFRPARASDQLVLFLSGHGIVDPSTRAWHFLTADGRIESIAGTALEQDDILRKLEIGGTHHRVVVLVDTCQSGALADALPRDGKGLFIAGDVRPLDDDDARGRTGAWIVFTAGTSTDKAVEGPQFRLPDEPQAVQGHGLFTWAVLRALGGTAADHDSNGIVTLHEFVSFVSDQVRENSAGRQLPVVSGRQTDIALSFASGTRERCDGIDNNLDGSIDEGFDKNHNGLGDCLETEKCNGVDDNDNGQIDEGFDLDGDGHRALALCGSLYGDDCNDNYISIHPGQKDWGNLRDDDCDGLIDEEDLDIRPADGIPDTMARIGARLRRLRWATLIPGVALAGATAFAYAQLVPLYQPDDYRVPEDAGTRYARWSRWTTGLGGTSLVCLGASGVFTLQEHRLKVQVFPPQRRPVPSRD